MSASHAGVDAHRALVYRHADEYVERVGAFVRDGVDAGERVLAVAAPQRIAWLREELGPDAVDFAEADAFYARHGAMFRTVVEYLELYGDPGRGRVRIVAEQALATRSGADVRAYLRYEAASNVVFDRFDTTVLCPYDAERLPDELLDDVLRTHPAVLDHGHTRRSELFMDPRAFVRQRVRDTAVPPGVMPYALELVEDIPGARALVRSHAQAAGLGDEAVADLTLVVAEVAANAFIHGRPPRRLWSYVADDELICHVRDAGSGLPDPLAGYLPPDSRRLGGRGLWVAHQLCDIVEITSDATRTDVVLRTKLADAQRDDEGT